MTSFLKTPWRLFVILIFLAACFGFYRHTEETGTVIPRLHTNMHAFDIDLDSALPRARFSANLRSLLDADENYGNAMAYARFVQSRDALPEGFRETATRLAPQNAWFDLWELHHISEGVFVEIDLPGDGENTFPTFEVLDQERMDHLIDLFHQAAAKQEYSDYYLPMHTALAEELAPASHWLEEINYISRIASIDTPVHQLSSLGDFLGAANQHLIDTNDLEGFLRFEASSALLARKLHQSSHSLISALVLNAVLGKIVDHLIPTARHFQQFELITKYEKIESQLNDHADERNSDANAAINETNDELIERHGSIITNLAGVIGKISTTPKPVTEEDLLPTCRAENAAVTRFLMVCLFLLFTVVGILAWLLGLQIQPGQQSRPEIQFPSCRSNPYWKMILLGVTLPLAGYLLVRYLTPLGQLNYGASYSKFIHLTLPLVGLVVLILACSFVTALWTAGPDRQSIKAELFLIGLPFLSLFLATQYPSMSSAKWIPAVAALLALGGFLLFAYLFYQTRNSSDIQRSLITALMNPVYFLMAGYFGIWIFALMIEEKTWFARDDYATSETHFFSKNEARITARYLDQLGECLP